MQDRKWQTDYCENYYWNSAKISWFLNLTVYFLLRLFIVKELKLLLDVKLLNSVTPLLQLITHLPTGCDLEKTIEVKDHKAKVNYPFIVIFPDKLFGLVRGKTFFSCVGTRVELLAGKTDAHYKAESDQEVWYFISEVEVELHFQKNDDSECCSSEKHQQI